MNNKLFLAKYGDEHHVLDALRNSNDFTIAHKAARNPNQTDATFEAAMDPKHHHITLLHALNNPNFPAHLLRKTFEHEEISVRARSLNHPNFPQETALFDKALEDRSALIRTDAADSGKCSPEALNKYHIRLHGKGFSPI